MLLRVNQIEKPSRLGNWSYEVVDCKLARETKAETILQLCLYSEFVTGLQELESEFFHVIRPNVGFEPESYRLSAFAAYYRLVKKALQDALKASGQTYSRGGQSLRYLPVVERMRQLEGPPRRYSPVEENDVTVRGRIVTDEPWEKGGNHGSQPQSFQTGEFVRFSDRR